jgi:hypothetical protein
MPNLHTSEIQISPDNLRLPTGTWPQEESQEEEARLFSLYYSWNKLRTVTYYDGKICNQSDQEEVIRYTIGHRERLEKWRADLPVYYIWQDNEQPSTDMVIARLRGAYYEALYRALLPGAGLVSQSEELTARVNDTTQEPVLQSACDCMTAATQYAAAFDRIDTKRLVVPNILGTLHS